ncbi:extracellular solute-binding protein, partial [Mesorhizobium sp. M7A.F.Ca.CA.004.04.2.1]|uniref:ABC transporter substrate-binding protein n=1 Tax=Mesorhizobium sp. M7A.F.Ca.CA.004.04.2.1 TaxID=2496677 RepID=UPI0019D4B5BB
MTTKIAALTMAGAMSLAFSVPALAEGSLAIYAWADSISPEMVTKFEKETGIKVTVDAFSSNEDLLTKLQAGSSGYDIVTPSQHFVKIMIDSGMLEDFGASSMAAYSQVLPDL